MPSYTAYSVPYTRRQNQRFMRKMTVNLKLFLWFELKWSVAPFMEGQPRVMGKKCIYSMNSFSLHHVRGTHCILYAHIIHTYVSLCHLFYFLLKKQGLTEISYYFNSTIYLFQKKTWIMYTIENYYWWIYMSFHNIYSQLFYILGTNPCKTLNIFCPKTMQYLTAFC